MKKRLVRWLAVCCAACVLFPSAAQAAALYLPIGSAEVPDEIERMFDSALLAEPNSNTVLFEKDTDKAFTPTGGAVTLMTAYIVTQEADWEQEIPIIDAVSTLSSKVRKLHLRPGERWLVKDLTAGMLLHGAQDASLVLCDHVSGSETGFTALMNRYAKELGMTHTVYQNPLGAYASGQTTTVSDLLVLAR
ncbi:MAG: hypothetical protein PHO41_05935, partial [Eubacteriales bacterium]|nr:hypothetical protein [Eubacteriales bacterium]